MKNILRRLSCGVLAAGMLLAFCACNGAAGDSSVGTTSSQGGTTSGAGTPIGSTGVMTTEEIGEGFGGREVVFGDFYDGSLEAMKDDENYENEKAFREALEEKYNCKIVFTTQGGTWFDWYNYTLTTALSGNQIADVFFAGGTEVFPKWVLNNLLEPWDEYVDTSSDVWNQELSDFMTYNGLHYGLKNQIPDGIGNLVYFNKRLCAENGITDKELYELFFNKEWTWDKLREYAQKCTHIGATPETSTYGFSGWPYHAMYHNLGSPVRREGNSYVFNMDSANSLEAIQFYYDLAYTYNVMPPMNAGVDADTLWKQGKIAFYESAAYNINDYIASETLNNDGIGILLGPIGPQADDYINVCEMPTYMCMQPMTKDKELIGSLVTELFAKRDWESEYLADSFQNLIYDDESYDVLKMVQGRTVVDVTASVSFRGQYIWSTYGIADQIPPRTWAESVRQQAQYMLDQVWTTELDA